VRVRDAGHGLGLAQQVGAACFGLQPERLGAQQLEGNAPVQLRIIGGVHHAHAARAQPLQHEEVGLEGGQRGGHTLGAGTGQVEISQVELLQRLERAVRRKVARQVRDEVGAVQGHRGPGGASHLECLDEPGFQCGKRPWRRQALTGGQEDLCEFLRHRRHSGKSGAYQSSYKRLVKALLTNVPGSFIQ